MTVTSIRLDYPKLGQIYKNADFTLRRALVHVEARWDQGVACCGPDSIKFFFEVKTSRLGGEVLFPFQEIADRGARSSGSMSTDIFFDVIDKLPDSIYCTLSVFDGDSLRDFGTFKKLDSPESVTLNYTGLKIEDIVSITSVQTQLSNGTYIQDLDGQRNYKFDVNYTINDLNGVPVGTKIDMYVRFTKTNGALTKLLKILKTLNSQSGKFLVSVFDSGSLNILPDDIMRAEVFFWLRNTAIAISPTVGIQLGLVIEQPPIKVTIGKVSYSTLQYDNDSSIETARVDYNVRYSGWESGAEDTLFVSVAIVGLNGIVFDDKTHTEIVTPSTTITSSASFKSGIPIDENGINLSVIIFNAQGLELARETKLIPWTGTVPDPLPTNDMVSQKLFNSLLRDDILSGEIELTTTNSFDPFFLNRTIFNFIQIKNASGNVIDIFENQTIFTSLPQKRVLPFSILAQGNKTLTIESFVFDSLNNEFSPVLIETILDSSEPIPLPTTDMVTQDLTDAKLQDDIVSVNVTLVSTNSFNPLFFNKKLQHIIQVIDQIGQVIHLLANEVIFTSIGEEKRFSFSRPAQGNKDLTIEAFLWDANQNTFTPIDVVQVSEIIVEPTINTIFRVFIDGTTFDRTFIISQADIEIIDTHVFDPRVVLQNVGDGTTDSPITHTAQAVIAEIETFIDLNPPIPQPDSNSYMMELKSSSYLATPQGKSVFIQIEATKIGTGVSDAVAILVIKQGLTGLAIFNKVKNIAIGESNVFPIVFDIPDLDANGEATATIDFIVQLKTKLDGIALTQFPITGKLVFEGPEPTIENTSFRIIYIDNTSKDYILTIQEADVIQEFEESSQDDRWQITNSKLTSEPITSTASQVLADISLKLSQLEEEPEPIPEDGLTDNEKIGIGVAALTGLVIAGFALSRKK